MSSGPAKTPIKTHLAQAAQVPAEIVELIDQYPPEVQSRLYTLRQLIFRTADETDDVGEIEETLKWGEPSYRAKRGSPMRLDWKDKTPAYYFLYFHCQTPLIETFRALYKDELSFEGNRAIRFDLDHALPIDTLKHCIEMALKYHQIKHLPTLGVNLD